MGPVSRTGLDRTERTTFQGTIGRRSGARHPPRLDPMAINSALRKFSRPARGPKAASYPEPIAIGEVDAHVFNCPRCARPLAIGAHVCPGCGTRLLFGVRARMALGLLAAGLAIGVLIAGAAVYVARPVAPGRVSDAGAGAVPSVGAGAIGVSPTAPPVLPAAVGIPSSAVSAMRQAAILDARITVHANELRALLKSKATQGIEFARVLRTLNTDATFGVDLAPEIAHWDAAAKLSYDLGSFYRAVRDSSRASLRASVSDSTTYRTAGKRMSTLLLTMRALDATAAGLVDAAGLAPLVPPTAAPSATVTP
jgi:hypothetical protein